MYRCKLNKWKKNSLVFRFLSTQTTWFDPNVGFHTTKPNQTHSSRLKWVSSTSPAPSPGSTQWECECGAYYTNWKKKQQECIYKFSSHQLLLMYKEKAKKRLYDRNDVVIDNVKRNGISPLCRCGEKSRADSYKKALRRLQHHRINKIMPKSVCESAFFSPLFLALTLRANAHAKHQQ